MKETHKLTIALTLWFTALTLIAQVIA